MSRVASIAASHRRAHHLQRMIPAGGIIAAEVLIAAIPDKFVLCDGSEYETGKYTPDLGDQFIIGRDATYNGVTAEDLSLVSAIAASAGGHNGSPTYKSGAAVAGDTARADNTEGASTHTYAAFSTVAYDPPHYKLAYIMATEDTTLPAGAIVWVNDTASPTGFSAYSMADYMIKGQTGDTRGSGGSDTFSWALMTCSSTGGHDHNPDQLRKVSTPYLCNVSDKADTPGAHSNHTASGSGTAVKPLYIGLFAAQVDSDGTGATEKLVLGYWGDLADLPAGWQEADGTNGTRDCRGRIPIAIGGDVDLGDLGGDMADFVQAVTSGSGGVSHEHRGGAHYSNSQETCYHFTYTNTHNHVVTVTIKKQVPVIGLYFIEYVGT